MKNLHNVNPRLYEMALHLLLEGTGPFEGFHFANLKGDFRKAVNANASLELSSAVETDLAFALAVREIISRRYLKATQEARAWQSDFDGRNMVSVCYDPDLIAELLGALDHRAITGLVIHKMELVSGKPTNTLSDCGSGEFKLRFKPDETTSGYKPAEIRIETGDLDWETIVVDSPFTYATMIVPCGLEHSSLLACRHNDTNIRIAFGGTMISMRYK